MARLIHAREIAPHTFLHCTHRGQATCLRDYSHGPLVAPREQRGFTRAEIDALLCRPGNRAVQAPFVPWERTDFWYEQIMRLNARHGLPGSPQGPAPRRLLDLFQSDVGPLLQQRDTEGLAKLLVGWVERLTAIVEKTAGFNHWDLDDASARAEPATGLGLTAAMLEHSRNGGRLEFLDTGDSRLDFALLAMDLHLGISSAANPFGPGARDFINPDGLGLRRDGTFAVLEVKGEKDSEELFQATVQALCGVLAVYARRDMIVRIGREPAGRRPGVPNAAIPADEPSLGLYVLVSSRIYRRPSDPAFRECLRTVLGAFAPLREIVFFSADPRSGDFPAQIPADLVVSRDKA